MFGKVGDTSTNTTGGEHNSSTPESPCNPSVVASTPSELPSPAPGAIPLMSSQLHLMASDMNIGSSEPASIAKPPHSLESMENTISQQE
ncbi:hypothetical protein PILCRDRAFT_16951 [Piloderma croceum F 1598]|uniref:Uncharacterized protein n=1 Tax=Piloderma croceum (strain F 1598) TaxID=765440 RepID=A0A0C3ACR4_PILCF|nr:hypothetical protein PILCRDRAFT_16951 [Piloderma croceum F 1598]